MPSQTSTAPAAEAIAPKRQRGRDRVEAILRAATALFAEKGYDGVTMTEVAARASTAIGSLYRFFPTKEALAGALLERYGADLTQAVDAIAFRAGALTPAEAAAALVDVVERLRHQRSAALALIDLHSDSPALRQALRGAMIERLERLLVRLGAAPGGDTRARAILLLHLLKTAWALDQEEPAMRTAYAREIRRLIRLYLAAAGEG
jgi:AcrR family transcriptional regulator